MTVSDTPCINAELFFFSLLMLITVTQIGCPYMVILRDPTHLLFKPANQVNTG